MKKLLLATSTLLALTLVIYLASCGQLDPAWAPAGSTITLVSAETIEWEYGCSDGNLSDACHKAFRDYCVAQCAVALQAGSFDEGEGYYKDCLSQSLGDEAFCAEYVCDDYSLWNEYCYDFENDLDHYGQAVDYLSTKSGRCGYANDIVSALVTRGISSDSATGSTAVEPLNDVEVRWIADGGEMYEVDDVPGDVAPLANPHYSRTDERGVSEIKYRLPFPATCGSTYTYNLTADIGVDMAFFKATFTVEEPPEETDDDTSGDDDTGAR